ncbi:MAG TPA: hypothetical protein DC017_06610 [Candidatus Wallbacteria bacterium]|nr:hypothetical protein [Candidatus Wallbacteria bacterium]
MLLFILGKKLHHGYIYQLESESLLRGGVIDIACYQPIGRLSDNADLAVFKISERRARRGF